MLFIIFHGNSNFVKSKNDAFMSLQPGHFCKAEVQAEKGFEVAFSNLLSIPASPYCHTDLRSKGKKLALFIRGLSRK